MMRYVMNRVGRWVVGLFVVGCLLSGRPAHELPNFRAPVDGPLRLSGTFGELRSNHFHSGIDIKARNGRVGQPLYACDEGFVSRIKIQSGGYGNALYIDHPSGYTTVYAHLQEYSPKIQRFVKEVQYREKRFELDVDLEPNQLPIGRGEVIGKLGVSGRSFGPHLHFEVRETASEKPVNPLLFNFQVPDDEAPRMHELKVYHLDPEFQTLRTEKFRPRSGTHGYFLSGDTLSLNAWRVGFGIKTYDRMPYVTNWNGVHSIKMYVEDRLAYHFQMDKFDFAETRYINAHMDYEERVTAKSYFNRCYVLPGNALSAYPQLSQNGVVELQRGRARKITLESSDIEGNTSRLTFWVRRGEVPEPPKRLYNYHLPQGQESLIETDQLRLFFPKGTFYRDLFLRYRASNDGSSGVYSSVHHVHDYTVPVHQYYDISILPRELPAELREKAFIAYCDSKNRVYNCGGKWDGQRLRAQVRDLGDFCIMVDDEAPRIQPVAFSTNLKGYNRIKFKISDNYRSARNVAGLQYRTTVGGEWILMEYDEKNDLLTYVFDEHFPKGTHVFRLEVWDAVGNRSVYEREVVR